MTTNGAPRKISKISLVVRQAGRMVRRFMAADQVWDSKDSGM
jgi:hypothetical protein